VRSVSLEAMQQIGWPKNMGLINLEGKKLFY